MSQKTPPPEIEPVLWFVALLPANLGSANA